MPATAPIPPDPADPAAQLGVATGHDGGYGRYLVATGPYMLAGSAALQFAEPGQPRPVNGYVPGRSITLVRNPSWDRRTDDLRGAYVDRIEIAIGGSIAQIDRSVDRGRIDMLYGTSDPLARIRQFEEDPRLAHRVFRAAQDGVFFMVMNVAVPPFNDVHVRRAVNLAIDKADLVRLAARGQGMQRSWLGTIATHIAPDSLENDVLVGNHDPYATPGGRGSRSAAAQEMAKSRYDTNHDGVCDIPVCKDIVAPVWDVAVGPAGAALIEENLRPIGLDIRTKLLDFDHFFPVVDDPKNRVPFRIDDNWAKDFPGGFTFFHLLFHGGQNATSSLVGATPEQLERWGYSVEKVPNVDDRVDQCAGLTGDSAATCWAALDNYLMQVVVPWVPFMSVDAAVIASDRVTRMSFDQFCVEPALDQIALAPGAS
jgi:peptide/nickel transport system substrate-binding protein